MIRQKIYVGFANPVIRDSASRWQEQGKAEKPGSTIPQVQRISRNMYRQPSRINEARMTKADGLSTRHPHVNARSLLRKYGEGDAGAKPTGDADRMSMPTHALNYYLLIMRGEVGSTVREWE